jgi:hypothetical protein
VLLGNTSAETSDIERSGDLPAQSKIGGCFTGEDPDVDARTAQPRWVGVASVSLVPSACVGAAPSRFSLWRIPGRKQLFHAGAELQLRSRTDACSSQVRLALGLKDSDAFAYVIPADESAGTRLLAVRESLHDYRSATKALCPNIAVSRSSRSDLFHMRALQTFDATVAGATHREIADVLFGSHVVASSWSTDSDIRAQVRHLIKRARHYVNRGYFSLLCASDARAGTSRG